MVGHGGSSAGSYLADPTSPIPSHCAEIILFKNCPSASIVMTSTSQSKAFYYGIEAPRHICTLCKVCFEQQNTHLKWNVVCHEFGVNHPAEENHAIITCILTHFLNKSTEKAKIP